MSETVETPPGMGAAASPPAASAKEAAAAAPLPVLDRWIPGGLFVAGFLILLILEKQVGFPRDESVYFEAARRYGTWFRLLFSDPALALTDDALVAAWRYNAEHPPLFKALFALSHLIFHELLGWVRPATAFRLPALAASALVPALTYRLGLALAGRGAALFAALSFLCVPRQLFHAVLACFDMPIALMWLLLIVVFWRSLHSARAGWACGVVFGLALATKHNALFLPFVIVPFALSSALQASRGVPLARRLLLQLVSLFALVALLFGLTALLQGPARFQDGLRPISPASLYALLLVAGGAVLLRRLRRASAATYRAALPVWTMATLGPLLFYVLWPYLWHQPVERTAWFLAFHARHEHYAWFYLGELLRAPPFPLAYVVVKTALTVPTSLFVPMVFGWGALAVRILLRVLPATRARVAPLRRLELLVWVNATVPLLIISHPQVPHFGGVKHWLAGMPFLAILAGVSVMRAARALAASHPNRRLRSAPLAVGLSALLLLPALWGTLHVFPYGTAAYSELAGGAPGAASLGMQRQYWSSHVTGVLPWINAHAPQGARVWLHEVRHESFRDYQENGMLRPDLRPARGPEQARIAAYQYHQEFRFQEMDIWRTFRTTRPVTGLSIDGTPQVLVYERE